VDGGGVVFRLADPQHAVVGVRLRQDLGLPATALDFGRVDGGWELRLGRPAVQRIEYLFEVRRRDGSLGLGLDPGNPRTASGAFGDKSVLELAGYAAPGWLDVEPVPSTLADVQVTGTAVGPIDVRIWAPEDSDAAQPLPLLVAHDGPELAAHAALTRYAGAMIASERLPPFRLALAAPGRRNAWYSADLDYAGALVHRVIPQLRQRFRSHPGPVLMGVSLGALAGLHAEWAHPGSFGGLFLQSGSFFTLDTDPQEQGFEGFGAVTAFVARVLAAPAAPSAPPVAMTCGCAEENLANNRVLAGRLAELGVDVRLDEAPDAHNFVSWRDMLDPHLTSLLTRVWS
jgi:enterochelin esterase family protein